MKVLFFQWNSFMNRGIESALLKLDVPFDTFYYQFDDWEKDDIFLEKFRKKLNEGKYDKVFSVNFSPLISTVCQDLAVPYISWVYDSPIHIKNIKTMKNDCNRIYFFDRIQAQEYKAMGIHSAHMPLAADTNVFEKVIRENNWKKKYEVSFLGNLYHTEYNYFMSPLNDYLKGYIEGIIKAQMNLYGAYLVPELVDNALLEQMNMIYSRVATDGFQMKKKQLEFLLAQEATGRERYMALALLSNHMRVDVYSYSKDARLSNVYFHGYADYETVMPSVFASSKINLNISLKCIPSGIPLRGIEVMGCNGFLLSNYQPELCEYFVVGDECEVYSSIEELYQKAEFYLKNEELRKKISEHGYEKIKKYFTFEDRINKMIIREK